MKFGQLIEYDRNIFLQKSYTEWGRETKSRPFLFFKNALFIWQKQVVCSLYISTALNLARNKNKLYKTLDYWSRNIFNFDFLEKGLGYFFRYWARCVLQ